MTKEIRRGETVPLEHISKAFKIRALEVARRAVELDAVVPADVTRVLEATDHDIQVAQYSNKETYLELDDWMQRQFENL